MHFWLFRGRITPGLNLVVGGSFTFLVPTVCGVFLIFLFPVFAFDSCFCFFLGGPGRESNSSRQATSSVVKI